MSLPWPEKTDEILNANSIKPGSTRGPESKSYLMLGRLEASSFFFPFSLSRKTDALFGSSVRPVTTRELRPRNSTAQNRLLSKTRMDTAEN